MAVVGVIETLIETLMVAGTVDTVVAESRVTVIFKADWKTATRGVVVAVVEAVSAFVDVSADVVFYNKAGIAVAAVEALRVDTETIVDVA